MAHCMDCKVELTPANSTKAGGKCRECWRRRYRQGISDVFTITGEGVVETPRGWMPVGMVDGEPVIALCDHVHATQHEAEACLAMLQDEVSRNWRF